MKKWRRNSNGGRRHSTVFTPQRRPGKLLALNADVMKMSLSDRLKTRYNEEEGAVGYILLWMMGVPASILFLIFFVRGCN